MDLFNRASRIAQHEDQRSADQGDDRQHVEIVEVGDHRCLPGQFRIDGSKRRSADLAVSRRLCRIYHRTEEHTSELQSLMRKSYAVFCLKKKHKLTISISTHKYNQVTKIQ